MATLGLPLLFTCCQLRYSYKLSLHHFQSSSSRYSEHIWLGKGMVMHSFTFLLQMSHGLNCVKLRAGLLSKSKRIQQQFYTNQSLQQCHLYRYQSRLYQQGKNEVQQSISRGKKIYPLRSHNHTYQVTISIMKTQGFQVLASGVAKRFHYATMCS